MTMDSITKDIGIYVLIEAANMGQGFHVAVKVNADRKSFPLCLELEEALENGRLAQEMLRIPDDHLLISKAAIGSNAGRSLASKKVQKYIRRHVIV